MWRLASYLQAEVRPKSLTGPLLLITFTAGILDITTYVNFGTFASNQTGYVPRSCKASQERHC
jgi:uncharacterized membrane protein YoaK (UPF0700 family)